MFQFVRGRQWDAAMPRGKVRSPDVRSGLSQLFRELPEQREHSELRKLLQSVSLAGEWHCDVQRSELRNCMRRRLPPVRLDVRSKQFTADLRHELFGLQRAEARHRNVRRDIVWRRLQYGLCRLQWRSD